MASKPQINLTVLKILFSTFLLMHVVRLSVSTNTCAQVPAKAKEGVSDPLELQMVVRYPSVGAGNWTRLLSKSGHCS